MREIVFDTETTGLDPASGHRLVEIGCVELIGRIETGRSFHAYINPRRSMPPEAEAGHGLSEHFLSDKPEFGEIVEAMLEFFGDAPLIAHNAQFDIDFLDSELRACGRPHLGIDRAIDTLTMARMRHPGAKHTLDALCTRYGIDRSHRIKHGALLDAQLLTQVYIELSGGRQIGLELGSDKAKFESVLDRGVITVPAREVRPPRPHAASPEELARHAVFLDRISDPLWQSLMPAD